MPARANIATQVDLQHKFHSDALSPVQGSWVVRATPNNTAIDTTRPSPPQAAHDPSRLRSRLTIMAHPPARCQERLPSWQVGRDGVSPAAPLCRPAARRRLSSSRFSHGLKRPSRMVPPFATTSAPICRRLDTPLFVYKDRDRTPTSRSTPTTSSSPPPPRIYSPSPLVHSKFAMTDSAICTSSSISIRRLQRPLPSLAIVRVIFFTSRMSECHPPPPG